MKLKTKLIGSCLMLALSMGIPIKASAKTYTAYIETAIQYPALLEAIALIGEKSTKGATKIVNALESMQNLLDQTIKGTTGAISQSAKTLAASEQELAKVTTEMLIENDKKLFVEEQKSNIENTYLNESSHLNNICDQIDITVAKQIGTSTMKQVEEIVGGVFTSSLIGITTDDQIQKELAKVDLENLDLSTILTKEIYTDEDIAVIRLMEKATVESTMLPKRENPFSDIARNQDYEYRRTTKALASVPSMSYYTKLISTKKGSIPKSDGIKEMISKLSSGKDEYENADMLSLDSMASLFYRTIAESPDNTMKDSASNQEGALKKIFEVQTYRLGLQLERYKALEILAGLLISKDKK